MPLTPRFKASEADTDLIARLNQQDHDAMRVLTDRYSRMIYAVALRILKSPAEAEDTVQDVLLQLWMHPPVISEKYHSLAPWIAISTRNRAIDLMRRRPAVDSHDLALLQSKSNVAREVETQTDMRRIHQAMRALPLKQQFVLQLAFRQELSHPEIAKVSGIPLGTVKTRLRTGLATLRKTLFASTPHLLLPLLLLCLCFSVCRCSSFGRACKESVLLPTISANKPSRLESISWYPLISKALSSASSRRPIFAVPLVCPD